MLKDSVKIKSVSKHKNALYMQKRAIFEQKGIYNAFLCLLTDLILTESLSIPHYFLVYCKYY